MIKKILLGLILFLFLGGLWFIPWTPVLHLGFLIYFPYNADKSRFVSFAGPKASFLGLTDWEEQVPSSCLKALVASEDTTFAEHEGIDWKSLNEALEYNKKHSKKRGASTLTQQLVKNAFLSRDQSYLRKAREILGTIMLDKHMSKKDQLIWYWNIVEFGPRIYGIHKASQYYFKKEPSSLSSKECAALVALLPSPLSWGKSVKKGLWSSFIYSRIEVIEKRIRIMDWAFLENKKYQKPIQDKKSSSIKPAKPQKLPDFKEPSSKDEEKSLEAEEDILENIPLESILSQEEEKNIKENDIKENDIKENDKENIEKIKDDPTKEDIDENIENKDLKEEDMKEENSKEEDMKENSLTKKETFED